MHHKNVDKPALTRGRMSIEYPESLTFTEKKDYCSKGCLVACMLLFLLTSVVFLALFLLNFKAVQDMDASLQAHQDDEDICTTADCFRTAALLAKRMDTSVDPCVDFYQYACGNYEKTAVFKEGRTVVNPYYDINDDNIEFIKGIITEEGAADKWNYMKNMKKYYASCVDEAKIEEIGVQPYLDSAFAAEWPTLQGEEWAGGEAFDLDDTNEKYGLVYVEPIFSYYVSMNKSDTSSYMLGIVDPDTGLPRVYYDRPRNDSVILAYEKYLVDFAVELGANETVAKWDAADIINFYYKLAAIIVPQEERRDLTKIINPTTLSELGRLYSFIDIPRAIRAGFSTINITLDDDQAVNVDYPSFFEQLEGVLAETSNRTLQNMFSFAYAKSQVGGLTKRLREILLEFDKVFMGKTEESPRKEHCLYRTIEKFSLCIGKEYVSKKFSAESKAYMNDMVDRLMAVFDIMLGEATWMGENTQKKAHEKLALMGRKIGYPDVFFENEYIEDRYKEVIMEEDAYYSNNAVFDEYATKEILKRLRQPVDKRKWVFPTYSVNAYHGFADNDVVFPAGLLQPPFFSDKFPHSINYAAIGSTIGHEITHGFDDKGSQRDKYGNVVNWWDPEDRKNFHNRSQCMVDQYSAFYLESVGMNLNGIITLGENIADNGGLKASYRAYEKFVSDIGTEPQLPGFGFTNEQLFFLGYAQSGCEKMAKERVVKTIQMSEHAPTGLRILGSIQNSEEFAEAFSCPIGSQMNPEIKCSVW